MKERIDTLWEQERYDEACRLADRYYQEAQTNVMALLYYGRCRFRAGDINAAMTAYDQAEILDETNTHVNRFLGDLYLSINNYEIAKGYYDKAEIAHRSALQSNDTHRLSLLLQFNGGYDSNVYYSAQRSELDSWYDTPPLQIPNKPQSDFFSQEYLRVSHRYDVVPISSVYIKSRFYLYNKNYTRYHDEDYLEASLLSGLGWESNGLNLWLPIRYSYATVATQHYSDYFAFEPQIKSRFQNGWFGMIEALVASKRYRQWEGSDHNLYGTKILASKRINRHYFEGNYRFVTAQKNHTNSDRLFVDRYYHEGTVNYVFKADSVTEFGAGYRYRHTLYEDAIKNHSSQQRHDSYSRLSAYSTYNYNKYIGLMLKYAYYHNATNYTPLDYDKQIISLGGFLYF